MRILYRSLAAMAIAVALLAACLASETVRIPVKKKGAGAFFQIRRGEQWGYMNRGGKVVISPQFDDEGDFFESLAKVQKDGKWGYVGENGRVVIPYQFDNAGDFKGGLAPVQVGRKWGYIDSRARIVVEPQFEGAGEFSDGLARFENWNTVHCGRTSYTKEDAPLFAFRLHDVVSASPQGCFSESARFGFVDRHGTIVIAPTFVSAQDFSQGLAVAQAISSGEVKFGYIDKTGKFVIEPQFDQAYSFSEGLAAVEVGFRAERGKKVAGKWGFINREGRFAVTAKFELANSYSEGLASVCLQLGAWGYIDTRGAFVIPPQYSEANSFSDGLALVHPLDAEDGYYIDRTGRKVLKLKIPSLWSFSDGLTVAGTPGEQRYVDRGGKIVGPYENTKPR